MSITTENKPSVGTLAGRGGLIAMIVGGIAGIGCLGFLLTKAFRPVQAAPGRAQAAGEARIAAKMDAARDRSEAGASRMRQEEVGTGYQFDAQGNYLAPKVDTRDLPENQPLVTLEASQGTRPTPPAPQEETLPWRKEESADTDPNMARERREARKEDRQDLRASMLGYSTSAAAQWAARRAVREDKGSAEAAPQTTEEAQTQANIRSMERLTALAERSMSQGQAEPSSQPRMPAESASQAVPPGEVADMRISGGSGADETIREGKFLDCVTINRVESDIADSPVMAQVARDFVSLDGKQVLVPAGAKIYGTAGRVESLQQARLFIRFHKIVFPRRNPEETPKVAYFPSRAFPAMDQMGSLGGRGRVNRHLTLQFGAAIALGVIDGLAARAESPDANNNPTARDMMMQRTSQNFANIANSVIQRYANVVPTVTIREGTKLKCYFTQDVLLTPFMPTRELSWMKVQP